MNIMGIDLGSVKSAYTHITGNVDSPKFDVNLVTAPSKVLEERIVSIMDQLLDNISLIKPELLVVEYPFNIKGHAKILVELFGVIHYYALKNQYNFIELPQTRIKKYCSGSGKAEKSDMRMQVYKEYGLDLTEDEADSFWIAHMGMTYLYGSDKKFRQESIDAMKKPKGGKKRDK